MNTDSANNQTPLLTPEQAVDVFGGAVTVGTLRNWRFLGQGPKYLKIGRRVLYRRNDLDRYLESCVRNPEGT